MKKETQGKTDLYIASWLKSQSRDKVLVVQLTTQSIIIFNALFRPMELLIYCFRVELKY